MRRAKNFSPLRLNHPALRAPLLGRRGVGAALPVRNTSLPFYHPPVPPQAGRGGPGRGCRLSDRAGHRLLPGRGAHNAPPPARTSRPGSITRPAREFRQTRPGPPRHAPHAQRTTPCTTPCTTSCTTSCTTPHAPRLTHLAQNTSPRRQPPRPAGTPPWQEGSWIGTMPTPDRLPQHTFRSEASRAPCSRTTGKAPTPHRQTR